MGHGMGGAAVDDGLNGPRDGVLWGDLGSVYAEYGVEVLPRLSNGECRCIRFWSALTDHADNISRLFIHMVTFSP